MDSKESLIHELNTESTGTSMNKSVIIALFMFVLLGLGSGFIISNVVSPSSATPTGGSDSITTNGVTVNKGDVIGSEASDFTDNAEGTLTEGGIDGEGAYHLQRPGGESQNVYLTSSVLDLSPFVGRKVKVWGQTQTAQSAGWLMDVGRLQVLD